MRTAAPPAARAFAAPAPTTTSPPAAAHKAAPAEDEWSAASKVILAGCRSSCRSGRIRQMRPHLLHDRIKRRRIAHGQFAEHLAIQLDARLGQRWNKPVVMNPALLERCVQSRNPQAAEMPLLLSPIAISVNAGLAGKLNRRAIDRPRSPHEP